MRSLTNKEIVALNSTFYYGAYFTEQYVFYFTLAFSITFYVGAYLLSRTHFYLVPLYYALRILRFGFYMLISTFYYFQ